MSLHDYFTDRPFQASKPKYYGYEVRFICKYDKHRNIVLSIKLDNDKFKKLFGIHKEYYLLYLYHRLKENNIKYEYYYQPKVTNEHTRRSTNYHPLSRFTKWKIFASEKIFN